jgi:RecA-family ATPase
LLQRPIIHGLLRAGETMNVIVPPKVGKSWLVSDMALAVATGRPWLDRFDTERGDVLIIDNELHPTTSAHRIPKVMAARGITDADVSDHVFVSNLRGNLRDIKSLGKYFDHVHEQRFRMIIIDAFSRMLPANADENDNAAMAGVYNLIDQYAEAIKSEADTLCAATFRQICSMSPPPGFKSIYEADKLTWINAASPTAKDEL